MRRLLLLSIIIFGHQAVQAAVLPEDRADVLYHSFDGGGVDISGPSVLIRKKFGESFSASYNNYVDNVSSASIDVVTTASPYTENRDENTISLDYLHEKTTLTVGLSNSVENDYDSTTFSFNISQDMFGDLTTVSMGFGVGDNEVGRNGDDSFSEEASTRSYRFSVSQILTTKLLMVASLETITDEGFLNNPYRSVRYFDASVPSQFVYQAEVYPRTRTSNAFAVRGKYFLDYRAAVSAGYRFYTDSWGIDANTIEFGYTHPYGENWIFDGVLRFYEQNNAEFYSDLFPFEDAQNFLARDKELSTFTSTTIGAGFSYEFNNSGWTSIKRASLNFHYDYILFDYDDFRDLTRSGPVGEEPLYSFSAGVIRAFASVWF